MPGQESQSEIVTLVDEEGREHAFFMVDSFQVNSRQYAVLVPIVYHEEEYIDEEFAPGEEAYIFRIDRVEGEEILCEVEEEEEWAAAAREYEIRQQTVEENNELL